MMSQLHFDHLKIGDELPALVVPPITRHQLALYCGGSGDHNPMHTDSDFARAAGMPDVFAHGMLSMAFMARFVTRWIPQQAVRSLEVRFQAITWIGDQITVRGHILDLESSDQSLTLEMSCTNQRGETTLTGRAVVQI